MEKISAVIVDDDMRNGELLVHFLKKYCSWIIVIGHAFTKKEAISLINEKKPQLLFLDIVLDIDNGFDLLNEVTYNKAKVIFVTAFEKFAIKAFKYNAVDYLLKPLQIEELIIAVNKAREDIEKDNINNDQVNLLFKSVNNNSKPHNFIAIPSLNKINFINLCDIIYFEADGKYTFLHLLNGKKIITSKNLGEYEKTLKESVFYRIHHSYIVNITHILNIDRTVSSCCQMVTGKSLPISKRRQNELFKFLKIK